jgi:excisionase family DNA binding protein
MNFGTNCNSSMTDSADQLAAAIRQVVADAVQAALKAQSVPEPPPLKPPKPVDEWPPERMLYPLREIQQKLSISRSTVYQLVGDGQLASVKIGHRRFVTAAALHAYIEGLK